jgi:hypothetical protein
MALDIWKMMAIDTVKLESGKTVYNFFQNHGFFESAESIGSETEKVIAEYLFTNRSVYDFIIEDLISDTGIYSIAMEIRKPLIDDQNERPGDIDVLLIPKGNESESIAVEVKCFKAITYSDQSTKVNKVNKILNANHQVNNYQKFGFHKIYFAIVLLDDARNDATPNQMLRSTKDSQVSNVFWEQSFDFIDESIGIVFIHISQVLNKSRTESLSLKTKVKREAKARSQNIRTTDKIRAILKADR